MFPFVATETKEQKAGYTASSNKLWKFIDQLEANLKAKQIKELVEHNGIPLERLDLYDQLYIIGFGLFHGFLDNCPLCNNNTLLPFRTEVRCRGWISGFTKCSYKGEVAKFPNRFKLRLSDAVLQTKFLKEWEHPDPKLFATFKDLPAASGSSSSSSASSSSAAAVEEVGTVEYELPVIGKECEGMTVCFVGTGISAEVKGLITSHGGEISKTVTKSTTHVIVSDPDQQQSAKPVKDALAKGLPVVSVKFLYALLGEADPEEAGEAMAVDAPAVEEAAPMEVVAEEKPKKGRGKKAASPAVEAPPEAAPEAAPALATKKSTRTRSAIAAPVEEQPAAPAKGRGRGKTAAAAGKDDSVAAVPPPAPAAKKAAKGKKVEKEEKADKEKKAPKLDLRLPEQLKLSGLLLFGSDSGVANLPQVNRKKRKPEEESGPGEFKKPKVAPIKGSDMLKVHPETGFATKGEILMSDDGMDAYNCTLNNVDLVSGKNRYYIMQIVKVGAKHHLFKKWGRTGGGQYDGEKNDSMGKSAAIEEFEAKFFESTGNRWGNKDSFEKKPGKYNMVSLDDGNDSVGDHEVGKAREPSSTTTQANMAASKLTERVQALIKLLFNVKEMEKVLQQMHIDTKKMPLGKLSKTAILNAYRVLKEIEEFMKLEEAQIREGRILDASTKFYTLIPHSFPDGVRAPPINKEELLKDKINMLDSLLDMEVAGQLMGVKLTTNVDGTTQNEVDAHYDSLKAEIVPLDKTSETYEHLKKFTQCSEHKIEVLDIFEVKREGEGARFKPWEKNENRQLLWHGSRLTNWVGILSQGLRIAPPEAPVSGYLFGKGVYFANMIEKSAHYCRTDRQNPNCLLSLNEVALGKMFEVTSPMYMEKSKPGYQSTKALGRRYPDPKKDIHIGGPEGPILPIGTVLPNKNTTMGHDEFIVYDISQIQCRYLIQGKFLS